MNASDVGRLDLHVLSGIRGTFGRRSIPSIRWSVISEIVSNNRVVSTARRRMNEGR